MDTERKNILIAVDGSNQSPETVRYVGSLFPEARAKITLFHITDLLPKDLSDYRPGSDPRYEVSGVREWAYEQMGRVEAFLEQAVQILVGWRVRSDSPYDPVLLKFSVVLNFAM